MKVSGDGGGKARANRPYQRGATPWLRFLATTEPKDRVAGEAVDLAVARISPHILDALTLIATAENDPGNQKLPG
jgi:hypothetical protein